jgi:hypothetical protein
MQEENTPFSEVQVYLKVGWDVKSDAEGMDIIDTKNTTKWAYK